MQFLAAILSMISSAQAQPGFLADFNYQVSELKSISKAQLLENRMTRDTRGKSICSNRAHLWANDLSRFEGVQTGKVFIHFTEKGEADENKAWAYHVAPYILIKGEEFVLDPAFDVFRRKPVPIAEWTKYFGKDSNCVVLDPLNNPTHFAMEKNNVAEDWMTPLDYKGGARQYPATEGICYIRKTPMYYQSPVDVYGHDLYVAGNKAYEKFNHQSFVDDELLESCQQATTREFKRNHSSCYSYLGIKKERGFFGSLFGSDED